MTTAIQAWHFTANTLRGGTPIPPVGEWLEHPGPLKICESGLHASVRLLDALQYAPGLTLHRVSIDGERVEQSDKLCARRRRIDETREVPLRAVVRLALDSACLAAWCAGQYLPDLLVALGAADREDWAAARAAANNAAWAAVSDAAWVAAKDAARAASAAANDAAKDAARAARAAANDAARAAAWAALEVRAVELLWGQR